MDEVLLNSIIFEIINDYEKNIRHNFSLVKRDVSYQDIINFFPNENSLLFSRELCKYVVDKINQCIEKVLILESPVYKYINEVYDFYYFYKVIISTLKKFNDNIESFYMLSAEERRKKILGIFNIFYSNIELQIDNFSTSILFMHIDIKKKLDIFKYEDIFIDLFYIELTTEKIIEEFIKYLKQNKIKITNDVNIDSINNYRLKSEQGMYLPIASLFINIFNDYLSLNEKNIEKNLSKKTIELTSLDKLRALNSNLYIYTDWLEEDPRLLSLFKERMVSKMLNQSRDKRYSVREKINNIFTHIIREKNISIDLINQIKENILKRMNILNINLSNYNINYDISDPNSIFHDAYHMVEGYYISSIGYYATENQIYEILSILIDLILPDKSGIINMNDFYIELGDIFSKIESTKYFASFSDEIFSNVIKKKTIQHIQENTERVYVLEGVYIAIYNNIFLKMNNSNYENKENDEEKILLLLNRIKTFRDLSSINSYRLYREKASKIKDSIIDGTNHNNDSREINNVINTEIYFKNFLLLLTDALTELFGYEERFLMNKSENRFGKYSELLKQFNIRDYIITDVFNYLNLKNIFEYFPLFYLYKDEIKNVSSKHDALKIYFSLLSRFNQIFFKDYDISAEYKKILLNNLNKQQKGEEIYVPEESAKTDEDVINNYITITRDEYNYDDQSVDSNFSDYSSSEGERLSTFSDIAEVYNFLYKNNSLDLLENIKGTLKEKVFKIKKLEMLIHNNYVFLSSNYREFTSILFNDSSLINKIDKKLYYDSMLLIITLYQYYIENIGKDINFRIINESIYENFFSDDEIKFFEEIINIFEFKISSIHQIIERFNSGGNVRSLDYIENSKKVKVLLNKASILNQLNSIKKYITVAEKKDENLFKLNYEIKHGDRLYRFRVLEDKDPYHFQVGADTNCCQMIGGAGENAAIDSFVNYLAGVFLLEVYNNDINDYELLCQSYFHYIPEDNGIILDNIENTSGISSNKKEISTVYKKYSEYLKNIGFKYMLCGISYTKVIDRSMFAEGKISRDPRNFDKLHELERTPYSDFNKEQFIIFFVN